METLNLLQHNLLKNCDSIKEKLDENSKNEAILSILLNLKEEITKLKNENRKIPEDTSQLNFLQRQKLIERLQCQQEQEQVIELTKKQRQNMLETYSNNMNKLIKIIEKLNITNDKTIDFIKKSMLQKDMIDILRKNIVKELKNNKTEWYRCLKPLDIPVIISSAKECQTLRSRKKLSQQIKQFYDKEKYSWFNPKSKNWTYYIDKNHKTNNEDIEYIYNIYVNNKLVKDTISLQLKKIIITILNKKHLNCIFNSKETYVSVNSKKDMIPFFYKTNDNQDVVYVCLTKEDKI